MKKRTFILAVCVLLVGMLAVNGTLAQTIENIFKTLSGGNSPERNEQQLDVKLVHQRRSGGQLVVGDSEQMLYPSAFSTSETAEPEKVKVTLGGADYQLWNINGVVDKFTAVKNNLAAKAEGAKDAYFRVAIAVDEGMFGLLRFNLNTDESNFVWEEDWETIQVNGKNHKMMIVTYLEALAPGEVSPPVLLQVGMAKEATNEDMEKAGSDFLKIKVLAVDADTLTQDGPRPGAIDTLQVTMPIEGGFNPF